MTKSDRDPWVELCMSHLVWNWHTSLQSHGCCPGAQRERFMHSAFPEKVLDQEMWLLVGLTWRNEGGRTGLGRKRSGPPRRL